MNLSLVIGNLITLAICLQDEKDFTDSMARLHREKAKGIEGIAGMESEMNAQYFDGSGWGYMDSRDKIIGFLEGLGMDGLEAWEISMGIDR